MKTTSVLYTVVWASALTAVLCYPSDLSDLSHDTRSDATAAELAHVSENDTSTSSPETGTERSDPSFDFDLPEVIKLFLNDTSNTTKEVEEALSADPDQIEHVDYSVDSNYDYYYDNENDEKPSIVKVSKVVSLVLKPAKKDNETSADDIDGSGLSSNDTVDDTTDPVPIVLTKTITYEKNLTESENGTSLAETGSDVGDIFAKSGSSEFSHAAGAPNTAGSEHLSSPSTFAVPSSNGFSAGDFPSENNNNAGTSFGSVEPSSADEHFDSDAVGSVHRRSAQELESDVEESESSTDVSVVASVSSSAGNYNRKIYETVSTDVSGGAIASSSAAEYDQAPQIFASDSAYGPSFPDYDAAGSESGDEHTTPAPYDEEAVLVQRQRLAELRRQFLEDESRAAVAGAGEEPETATDYEYSEDLATEPPALSLLPDAHRVIYY